MAQHEDGLTWRQSVSLIQEIDSARYLLRHGVNVLRVTRYIDLTLYPILTTLSIGVEKLLKISLGLMELTESEAWPSRRKMQSDYGHGVESMDNLLREHLHKGIVGKEYEPYIRSLIDAVDADPIWPQLLRTLDAFGRAGRFHHLDALGDKPQDADSPEGYWRDLENLAIESLPHLRAAQAASFADVYDQAKLDTLLLELRTALADSVMRWWEMIAVLARHGVLGARGKDFGFEGHPDAAFPPTKPGELEELRDM